MQTPISFRRSARGGRILKLPSSCCAVAGSFHRTLFDRRTGVVRPFLFLLILLSGSILFPDPAAGQFSFKTFSRSDSICYRGDAQYRQGGVIRLARAEQNKAGAIWHRRKQPVASGFTTRFFFQLGENGASQEADGIAFVIQNADACPLGNLAQGMGYDGIPNSIAIEFDTWLNEPHDPNNNHISIHTRGRAANSSNASAAIATRSAVPVLGLGVPRNVIIDYDGETIRIYMGECQQPILEAQIDLDSLLNLDGGTAWVGLTSATGNHFQNHDLFSWEYQVRDRSTSQKCLGDSVTLTGPAGYPRYRWSTGDTTRTIVVRTSGTYQLFAGGSLLCPNLETPYVFHVSVTPRTFQPRISPPGPIILCRGDSVELTALTGPYTGDRYVWSTGDTTRSIVAANSGRYAVTIIDTGGCEYRTDTVQVFIRPNPEPRILPGDTILLCSGDSVELRVPAVFRSYEWSTGHTGTSIVASRAGTYTLKVTDQDGCPGYDTAIVLMPDDIVVTGDTTICAGTGVRLEAAGRKEFRWSPAEGLSCTGCPDPFATPARTIAYVVTGSNDEECPALDTVVVTVRVPDVDAGADTTLCLGDTVRLVGRGDGRFSWRPTADMICPECRDPQVFPRTTTMYYLTAVDDEGCEGTDSVLVTVRSSGSVRAEGDAEICAGDSVRLSAVGATTYRWEPEFGLSCIACPDPMAAPTETTVYYVIGSNGPDDCPAVDSVKITVHDTPAADAGGDTAICAGATLRLHATGGASYLWDASPALSCLDCPDPIAAPSTTTLFFVTVRSAEGCSGRDSVLVDVRSGLDVSAGEDRPICAGDSVRLSASASGAILWQWVPPAGLDCVDCPYPVASPATTTRYVVTAWNAEGCSGTDTIEVSVRETPEIVRLRIDRSYHQRTDTALTIAVESAGPTMATDVVEFDLSLRYDPRVLWIDESTIADMLTGTALEGWNVRPVVTGGGILILRCTAPPGSSLTLTEGADLLRMDGKLYLSNVRGTEIPFSVSSTSRCFAFETAAGYAQVDSICGLNLRLIELTAAKYVAPVAYPNPAPDRISFDFGLGLDGPTQLEVFDALGNRVGLIVDTWLLPGRYSVEWNLRDVPSGVYWYRLTSGDWSRGGQVMVE